MLCTTAQRRRRGTGTRRGLLVVLVIAPGCLWRVSSPVPEGSQEQGAGDVDAASGEPTPGDRSGPGDHAFAGDRGAASDAGLPGDSARVGDTKLLGDTNAAGDTHPPGDTTPPGETGAPGGDYFGIPPATPTNPVIDNCLAGLCCEGEGIGTRWDPVPGATYYEMRWFCSIAAQKSGILTETDYADAIAVPVGLGTACGFFMSAYQLCACNSTGCTCVPVPPPTPALCGGGCCDW